MLRHGVARVLAQPAFKPTLLTSRNMLTGMTIARVHRNTRTSNCPTQIAVSSQQRTAILQRYVSTTHSETPNDQINVKAELRTANSTVPSDTAAVSPESTVRHVFREEGVAQPERDVDMLAGVKSDLRIIKETFALDDVPREALYFGMAGVVPYVATSLSTIYLAWDINHAAATGEGFLLSGQTAELLLHILEPLQIGYGAVIISFLGAIHWGLEWAKYGGTQGYSRYWMGVVAPAIAWPTTLLPVEYALIAQFGAFTYLYFVDAKATVRGGAPPWYTTYRFVLTFIVGASLVLSLIGRGQIADKINRLPGPADRLKALRESQMANLEEEEIEEKANDASDDEDD